MRHLRVTKHKPYADSLFLRVIKRRGGCASPRVVSSHRLPVRGQVTVPHRGCGLAEGALHGLPRNLAVGHGDSKRGRYPSAQSPYAEQDMVGRRVAGNGKAKIPSPEREVAGAQVKDIALQS